MSEQQYSPNDQSRGFPYMPSDEYQRGFNEGFDHCRSIRVVQPVWGKWWTYPYLVLLAVGLNDLTLACVGLLRP